MNALIPLYVTLQTFVQDRAEQVGRQIRERQDAGVSALEYGALIVVAAVVVGILYGLVNGSVRQNVTQAINKLFNPGSAS
ncbi:hypothetical protein DZF91_33585 [Actinomadura logoneensis]|uniref:Flp family type IVb pilin n=1 Tax=Actinomadura logoneensis TaxID=2293572 RepID=A0A372JBK8_9ACTN|nr:hypothetical protein [Actinomadura logoneensis]RFU37299.1 hypothetical protein DZF91_33585 [Actinomadura logoneensis]